MGIFVFVEEIPGGNACFAFVEPAANRTIVLRLEAKLDPRTSGHRVDEHRMALLLDKLERSSRGQMIVAGLIVLVLIGTIDYLTGFELLFSVFYLLEVGLAAWFVGKGFGLLMSVLSVVVWIGGDLAAGAHYSNLVVPIWNAVILMVFYFIVVWLLTSLRSLHKGLEARVTERTQALRHEMAE